MGFHDFEHTISEIRDWDITKSLTVENTSKGKKKVTYVGERLPDIFINHINMDNATIEKCNAGNPVLNQVKVVFTIKRD